MDMTVLAPRTRSADAASPPPGDQHPPAARLGYVLASFPVLSETFVSNQVRAMRALGHTVVPIALAPHQGACQPDDEPFRAETELIGMVPAASALLPVALAALGPGAGRVKGARRFLAAQTAIRGRSLLLAGARVAVLARRHGVTHLHAHYAHVAAATAIVAARLTGLTCSFIGHGYDIYGTPSDLAAKLGAIDLAIATCDDMADDFRALCPTARIAVIPCGIDPGRFRPAPPGAEPIPRLLAIGRLVEQKGYEVLLAALAAIPADRRPSVDVVGTGPLEAKLRGMAADLGVAGHIDFLGVRASGWIAEHGPRYRALVAPFVICANGDRDTGPMVIKEAMAMGLPVVASALMGIKDYVTEATGRLVPPGDVPAFAEAMAWVDRLAPAERGATGLAGRARLEARFTLAGEALRMTEAIAALPAASARAGAAS
jgi:glycosyltransferase involved in cell wall biosynthesis